VTAAGSTSLFRAGGGEAEPRPRRRVRFSAGRA